MAFSGASLWVEFHAVSPKKGSRKYLWEMRSTVIKREEHILVDFTIDYDFYFVVRGRVHLCHHTCGSNYVASPTL